MYYRATYRNGQVAFYLRAVSLGGDQAGRVVAIDDKSIPIARIQVSTHDSTHDLIHWIKTPLLTLNVGYNPLNAAQHVENKRCFFNSRHIGQVDEIDRD